MATAVFALEPGAGLADETVSGREHEKAPFAGYLFGSCHASISLFEHDLF